MKKLVFSAIALTLTSAPGFASEDVWSQLDQEVDALASSLSIQGGGPTVSGWLATRYSSSSDITVGGGDLGGFATTDARVILTGSRGDYGYEIEWNAVGAGLLDAFVDFPVGGEVNGRVGMFKVPIGTTGGIDGNNLFFIDRSGTGGVGATRDTGVQFSGSFDQVGWELAATNGGDGAADELAISARIAVALTGEGASSAVEGAYGGPDDIGAEASLSFFEDGSVDDGDGVAIDVRAVTNVYSVGVEMIAVGDAVAPALGVGAFDADSSPITFQGTYMLTPDTWELGIRFQDFDNAADTEVIDLGVNRYIDGEGHNAKWSIGYVMAEATAGDADTLQAQLLISL